MCDGDALLVLGRNIRVVNKHSEEEGGREREEEIERGGERKGHSSGHSTQRTHIYFMINSFN